MKITTSIIGDAQPLGARGRRSTAITVLALTAALAVSGCTSETTPSTSSTVQLDTIIRGGTVFDGTGSPGRVADVGIAGSKIVEVGNLADRSAAHDINADGLYVSPGFIDLHSHTELEILDEASSSLTQGVTTETLGPDGRGRFDIADQSAEIAGTELSINVAPYVGFNTVWEKVVGEADVRPTDAQVMEMQTLFTTALEQGAWGISSGLGYFPARYSTTDEVIRSLGDVGPWRTMFSDHMRDETDFVIESVEENIAIGEATGLMAEATHMKVAGPLNWGESAQLLDLQAAAREAGHLAGGDVYPYTSASTGLDFYISGWAQDGGTEAMLQRFEDPEDRARIDQEVSDFVRADVGDPKNVTFPSLKNQSLADLMAGYGDVTIGEAVMRVLTEHKGDLLCVMKIGSEDDLKALLADPYVAISSDGGATESEEVHPRHYGTFPRFLGKYVREEKVTSWEDGIRKVTGLPASMLGLVDRGILAPGMAADVTVFNPDTIIDQGEFGDPKQYSIGVEYVFVNGQLALQKGKSTIAHSGKELLRSSSMPTRIQVVGEDQSVNATGTVSSPTDGSLLTVKIDAEQSADNAVAAGNISILNSDGIELLDVIRFGRVQTAPDWFTVSGVATVPGQEAPRAFQIIVDHRDPLAKKGEKMLTLRVDGADDLRGVLVTSES